MKRILISLTSVLCCVALNAQSLNSTVDVSNEYLSTFDANSKADIKMQVPDSLLQFNKEFDYMVFENPFKGSYEFSPYSVQLIPEVGNYGTRRFYMRAGAGYQMYPVLDAVYSPELKDNPNLKLSIFQKGNGFVGRYCDSKGEMLSETCMNLSERLGMNLHFDDRNMKLRLNAAYDGVYSGEVSNLRMMHGADLNFGLATFRNKYFSYKLDLAYKFANLSRENRHFADVGMTFEPKTEKTMKFPVDVKAQFASGAFLAGAAPHIRLMLGTVDLLAGAKFTFWSPDKENKYFRIAPDIHAAINIVDAVSVYADVDGGQTLISANDILHCNPFVDNTNHTWSDETIRFNGGVKGRIGGGFEFDINGGYSIRDASPLDCLSSLDLGRLTVYYVEYKPVKFNVAYANAVLSFSNERLDMDAGVHYRFTNLTGNFEVFDLPMLSGTARVTYNWQKRIYVGVGIEGSSDRAGAIIKDDIRSYLPGYLNLGASLEYRLTREFGIWVRGTNLLNNMIMRTPSYIEKGINIIGGISLNI